MSKLISYGELLIFFTALSLCKPLPAWGAEKRDPNHQQLHTIELYMDGNVDPCDDYYQYACGNWELTHDDTDYSETIGYIDHKVDVFFARILKTARKQRLDRLHKFIGHVFDYYKSCMNVDEYMPEGYLEQLRMREQLQFPTPLPRERRPFGRRRNKSKQTFDWLKTLATLRKYGFNGVMIEESVIQKQRNARSSAIDIDKPVLNGGFRLMPQAGFLIIMEYLGIEEKRPIEKLWKEVHAFERKLKSLNDMEDDTDENDLVSASTVREVPLSELKMPWLERYLSIILDKPVSPHMNITIQNLSYFHAMFGMVNDHEPEFVCRYLMLRFLWYLNIDGPRNFLKSDCISHIRSMLPLAMHWLYEQHNSQLTEQKDDIEQLFANLLRHFKQTLADNSNRFDADILQFLQSKADNMRIKIGNLPRPNTAEQIEEFYSDLQLNTNNFYSNHLQMLHFNTKAKHQRLFMQLPQNDSYFHLEDPDTGASSSPYYLLRSNLVVVPLELLQLPIYHNQLHDVFKYSSLGFLLSHELTHGFDDSGVDFDDQGNMLGPSERIKANKIFDDNLECLRAKNPEVIDEKIADVSGFRWAYETYFKSGNPAKANTTEALSFTDLNPERLFFLNFAQFFCGASEVAQPKEVTFSEHGTDRQRVLDTLANFDEFGRVYECPVGSRMNPVRKCQLWG